MGFRLKNLEFAITLFKKLVPAKGFKGITRGVFSDEILHFLIACIKVNIHFP